jgi:hypothetical protein
VFNTEGKKISSHVEGGVLHVRLRGSGLYIVKVTGLAQGETAVVKVAR